ncbi:MAG: hypothetical protein ACQKBT_03380 [Puniceicoccales bacterium]
MPKRKNRSTLPLLLGLLLTSSISSANEIGSITIAPVESQEHNAPGREHMSGNQSRNRGMQAVPSPGAVQIDGSLDDWNLSGQITSFADYDLREKYSVQTALMWDEDYLYVSFQWKDDTPMFNMLDPTFDASVGWKSDSFAMRIATDKTFWITGWNFTPKNQPVIYLQTWNNPDKLRGHGAEPETLAAEPGGTTVGRGIETAYRETEDGFINEMKVPWEIMFEDKPEIKDGLTLRIGYEFIWGDPTGKTWPDHRYADNLQPGVDKVQFFWYAKDDWGDVTLTSETDLPKRQYRPEGSKLNGPVEIALPIPTDATHFTVVIDDQNGVRVRNLCADLNPADYASGEKDGNYQVQIRWDGRDDYGQILPTGTYQVRGLYHEGLIPYFDSSFYNPGTPPWGTRDGTGGWGADHGAPWRIAQSGDRMIVAFSFAEGGDGIIGIGPDGKKIWGEKRGATAIAADEQYVYALVNSWGRTGLLARFDAKSGDYARYTEKGEDFPFEIPLNQIINIEALKPGNNDLKFEDIVDDFTADNEFLYFSLLEDQLATVRSDDLSLVAIHTLPGLNTIAPSGDGNLYGIIENELYLIDPQSGESQKISTPGLVKAANLSVSPDGNIAIMDKGPDYQFKVYSPQGELVGTLAQKGGRPIRGVFEKQGVYNTAGIAYDYEGNLWATENWNYPRRISVWGPDGQLVKDFIGNTEYSGTGAFLHDDDPDLAYLGPIEMKLDRDTQSYEVTQILWLPEPGKEGEPETFTPIHQRHLTAKRFRSDAGGVEREFFYSPPVYWRGNPTVLFMEDDDGWRPVSALGLVGHFSGEIHPKGRSIISPPEGEFAQYKADDLCLWNDLNGDGLVQFEECQFQRAPEDAKPSRIIANWMNLGTNWNNTMNPEDLSFLVGDFDLFKPHSFTDKGAPVYRLEDVERAIGDEIQLSKPFAPYYLPEEDTYIAIQAHHARGERPNFIAIDGETQEEMWSYPNEFPGVHASHKAPMYSPGLLLGTLKIAGQAEVPGLGTVFPIRNNQGQDIYFTADGLWISSVFRDGRLPSDSLPNSLEDAVGQPLGGTSQGGEPFTGWFSRQSDGKYRLTTSLARQAATVVEMRGFETIQRFTGPEIVINSDALQTIADYKPPVSHEGGEKSYTIARVNNPLDVSGNQGWGDLETISLERRGLQEKGQAAIAYDDENLYLSYTIEDQSPWINEGKDFKRLFKTGDSVDIQLTATDPEQLKKNPQEGDQRISFGRMGEETVAVLLRPVDPTASEGLAHTYMSSVGPKSFDRVELRDDITVQAKVQGRKATIRAAIPWEVLEIDPVPGMTLAGDIGFITSDQTGLINSARVYWSNQQTGLVDDEPMEAWLYPETWGTFILGAESE